MQHSVEQKFIASIRWNTFEGILQNLFLFSHHMLLFKVVPAALFGQVGSMIACSYLLAAVASAGFYAIIGNSFHAWHTCQRTFLTYIAPHIIGSACVGLLLAFVCLTVTAYYLPINTAVGLTMGGLVISETIRETLKATTQTIFANKAHTVINTITIAAYCIVVWCRYLWGYNLDLLMLLLPLLCTSLIANSALVFIIARWLAHATEQQKSVTQPSHTALLKARIHGATYTFSTLPFNGNMLIPALAWRTGFTDVAGLKLANDATHYIGNLMRKAIYSGSHALFAHTGTINGTIHTHAWRNVRSALRYMLLWGIPLALIACSTAMLLGTTYLPALLAFGLLKLCDCFMAPHETRCLVEGKSHLLALLGATSSLLVAIICLLPKISPTILLCAIAMTRMWPLFLLWHSTE